MIKATNDPRAYAPMDKYGINYKDGINLYKLNTLQEGVLKLESSLFSMRSSFAFDQFKMNTPPCSIHASFGNHLKMIDLSQNIGNRTLCNTANV